MYIICYVNVASELGLDVGSRCCGWNWIKFARCSVIKNAEFVIVNKSFWVFVTRKLRFIRFVVWILKHIWEWEKNYGRPFSHRYELGLIWRKKSVACCDIDECIKQKCDEKWSMRLYSSHQLFVALKFTRHVHQITDQHSIQ